MADIATLGLAIDSRPVAVATAELNKLAPAARAAEVAAAGLQRATRGIGDSLPAVAKAMAAVERELERAVGDLNVHAVSLKNGTDIAGKGMRGMSFEARNLGFQMVDVTQGVLMGQSAFQIFAQQAGQIGQIIAFSPQGLGGLFKQLGGAIAAMITPMRLLGVGVVAAGVGAYAAFSSWKTFALQLDDTARAAGIAAASMAKLQGAAAFKGISSDDFANGMERFSQEVYQAQRGMGSLADWLRASGERATDFESTLERVAELINRASSYQQKLAILQAAGLPATAQWVRFLSGGADGIRRAKEEAERFGIAADREMIAKAREFDEAWDRGWAKFKADARSALIETIGFFDRLDQAANRALVALGVNVGRNLLEAGKGVPLKQNFDDFYNTFGNTFKKPGGSPVDPNAARQGLQIEQQRIALLGSLATVQDAIRAKEIEINMAALNGVGIRKEQVEALKRLAEFEAEAGKLQQQTQFGIFDSTRQMANAQLQLKTLIDNGTITNAQQYGAAWAVIQKNVQAAAEQAAIARSRFEGLTRYAIDGVNASKQLDQFGVSALSNIENGLVSFANGTKTAGEAFADMTRGIMSDLLRMIIRAQLARLVMSFLPGLGGGIGAGSGVPLSILPAIHHKGYGPGDAIGERRYVHPAYFDDAPRFHGGIGPGERPAVIRDDESVLTPGQMKALGGMIRGNQSARDSSSSGPTVVNHITNNFVNADPGVEARMREFVRASDEKTKNDTIKQFIKLQRDAPGATRPT